MTPAISPDGLWVAFSRRESNGLRHIYKVPIGGGAATQLTSESDGVDFFPQWSRDGTWITFDRQPGASDSPHHLYRVKSNGESFEAVYDPPTGKDAATPAYSPDDAIVLFGLGTHSYAGDAPRDVTTRTLDPEVATPPVIANYDDSTFAVRGGDPVLSPRLSPDGTRLALRSKQIWAARRNMDQPPAISSINGQSVNHETPFLDYTIGQDSTITLTASRSDPEGDALADSAWFLRRDLGMSFTPSTQTLSWPVGDATVGAYTVKFAATEASGGTDYALARITVRDLTPPARVTDVSADCDPETQNRWNLSWTATADDSTFSATGAAAQYDIRTYTSSITESNWSSASSIGGPSPGSPGATDTWSVVVTGTTYLRMKVKDDNNGLSQLSNQLVLHPFIDCGEGMWAGGGGGGGEGLRSQRAPQALSLQNQDVTPPVENSLFDGVAGGVAATDWLELPSLSPSGGSYAVRLREPAGRTAQLDAARLLTVDHSAGVQAFVAGGRVILGQEVAPQSAADGNGADATASVSGGAAEPFAADSGAALTVELGVDSTAVSSPVVVEASGGRQPSTGMRFEVPDGAGGWRTVAQLHPRQLFDALTVDSVASSRVRLVFLSSHQVRFVGRVARSSESPTLQWAQPLSAGSEQLGDVLGEVSAVGGATAMLAGPDTLLVSYEAPSLGEALVRECFLVVDATLGTRRGEDPARREPAPASIPSRFALHQSQPNPFSHSTTLRFDLPVGEVVRLEVFDLQGRRVQLLADRFLPAGYHRVEWDGRDAEGRASRPGIYFYRIEAGACRDRQRMVLLP